MLILTESKKPWDEILGIKLFPVLDDVYNTEITSLPYVNIL